MDVIFFGGVALVLVAVGYKWYRIHQLMTSRDQTSPKFWTPYPFADSGSTFGFWRDLRLDFGGVVRSAPSLDSTSGVSGRISN